MIQQGQAVGYIALEESVRRTALGIMGLHIGKQLHLEHDIEHEALRPIFEDTVGMGSSIPTITSAVATAIIYLTELDTYAKD